MNTASRFSAEGSGEIQVGTTTHNRLRHRYRFDGPHRIAVKGKGKGEMTTYRLEERLRAADDASLRHGSQAALLPLRAKNFLP